MRNGTRVLIVTWCYENINYGAFLQTYALKWFISRSGYNCAVLRTAQLPCLSDRLAAALDKGVVRFALKAAKKAVKGIYVKLITSIGVKKRNIVFNNDIERLTTGDIYPNKHGGLGQANELYDIFIAGSDQIWSDYNGNKEWLRLYFLGDITKPKISYAPSIGGGANFDRKYVPYILPFLNEFEYISVRESSGKKFLEEIMGGSKPIFHAVDPTLLLTAQEWDEIINNNIKDFKYEKDSYIFAYLLGASKKHRQFIRAFAKHKNLKIISFPFLQAITHHDRHFADIPVYDAAPLEMPLYIKNAWYVFTDSFHCALFAGLYHKDFFVFKKDNYGGINNERQFSRLEDLLELYGARERYIENLGIPLSDIDNITTDWARLDHSLAARREESRAWLNNALESAAQRLRQNGQPVK